MGVLARTDVQTFDWLLLSWRRLFALYKNTAARASALAAVIAFSPLYRALFISIKICKGRFQA
jgi:hypothetical protein